ncbi:MAG: ECF transporter S component [Ruminococcus sp.]|nr:ECF transporter S component [Ruminococcus sp.]
MTNNKQKTLTAPAENSYKIKKMVILGIITAMAFVSVVFFRLPIIPSVPFLDLEFKSAIILIGAFIFGPLSGLSMTLAVCIIEMFTISDTGVIGCIMNILSTACLVCPAAFVYKKKQTALRAIIGVIIGAILMTFAMVLWNYIVTPIYMGVPREMVVKLLIPAFIPFNLLKAGLNGGVALFIYKFAITALQKANLIPKKENDNKSSLTGIIGTVVLSVFIILTCILIILAFNGVF